MRYEISQFECRSSTFAVLCKSIGTRNAQAHDATLESTEESCAVFEDTRTMDSTIPSSGTDEFARHFRRCNIVSCVVCRIGCQIVTQSVDSNVITMQSMARDFGDERMFRIATVSSASKSIASRFGSEKIHSLETGPLWIQHHIRRKVLQLTKTLRRESS